MCSLCFRPVPFSSTHSPPRPVSSSLPLQASHQTVNKLEQRLRDSYRVIDQLRHSGNSGGEGAVRSGGGLRRAPSPLLAAQAARHVEEAMPKDAWFHPSLRNEMAKDALSEWKDANMPH